MEKVWHEGGIRRRDKARNLHLMEAARRMCVLAVARDVARPLLSTDSVAD